VVQRRCTVLSLATILLDFYRKYTEQGKYISDIPVVSKSFVFLRGIQKVLQAEEYCRS